MASTTQVCVGSGGGGLSYGFSSYGLSYDVPVRKMCREMRYEIDRCGYKKLSAVEKLQPP
jgi:hypothetical protein